MGNYSAILADVKSKVSAVPNIGSVYDYARWAATWSAFIALFKDSSSGKILGWEITRTAAPEIRTGSSEFIRIHNLLLSGYMGQSDADATDKTFQSLVDSICDAFRTADDGTSWYYMDAQNPKLAPAQADVIDVRSFGSVLCHHADITIFVSERILA